MTGSALRSRLAPLRGAFAGFSPMKSAKRKIKTDACEVAGQKRRETNDEPLFEVERPKENFLGQFKRITKRLDDLDLTSAAVHALI